MARCLNTGCGGPAARLFPKAAAGWVVSEFGRHGSKRKEAPSPGKDQSAGGGDDEDDGKGGGGRGGGRMLAQPIRAARTTSPLRGPISICSTLHHSVNCQDHMPQMSGAVDNLQNRSPLFRKA
uniref:Uncharacterized protein n=1 Tax=Oryza barthii TaxID=65489 RepID=A0A0D3H7C0_9ORYZ